MSDQMTLPGIGNATSLQESEGGATRCESPDGRMIGRSGQDRAHASHSRARPEAGTSARQVAGTCGQNGSGSSALDGLKSCLENRLPKPMIGSLRSPMTWKARDTKSGLRIFRLAPSGRITSGSEFGWLATPTATANQDCPSMQKHPGCRGVVVSPEEWCRRMGYPAEWLECAPLETPSSRRSRRNSSPPSST